MRADRTETFLRDDFGEAENGIERRAQLVAHIGEECGLGGIGGLGLEALAQCFVARLLQFARQVFDLEAQAGVLVDPASEAAAVIEYLRGEDRNENRRAVVDKRIAECETQGGNGRYRRQTGKEHVHVAGAADDETGEHCHGRAGKENVIELARRIPQQPGQQVPRQR